MKKTDLSTNKKKCVTRKINLNFFEIMKNGRVFPSKVCHFQYDNRLLFSREMGIIRSCKEFRLQKMLIVRIVFVLAFFRLLKIEESFGKSFSFSFSAKCFNRNFKYLFQKLLKFLILYFAISLLEKV